MAEENANGAEAPQVKMQVLAQFIRDLSFENLVAQKGLSGTEMQPEIQVGVNLDARQRPQPNTYDVIAKFKVTCWNWTMPACFRSRAFRWNSCIRSC
jgi:preprotein translocase subunit SecB